METKEIVPKLRFNSNYKIGWVRHGFTEIGEVKIGLTHTPNYVESGVPFLSSKNIAKGFIDFSDIKYVKEEEYDSMTSAVKPKKGDILFTRVGSNLGNPCILDDNIDFAIFVSLGIYRVGNLASNHFMKQWMDSKYFWKQVEKKVAGGAKNNLNTDWLREFKVYLPSLKEQQKIASFLSSVDEKISQLEKKKTLLETYKRGIMQKIFSQELRFKDENGQEFPDWEERKMGTYLVTKFFLVKLKNKCYP